MPANHRALPFELICRQVDTLLGQAAQSHFQTMPLDVCSQVAELTANVAKQGEIGTLGVVEYLIPRDLKKPLFAADQALPDGFLSGLPIQRRSEEGPESPWQSHRQGQQPPYRNTAKVSDNPAEVFCLLLHTDSSNGRRRFEWCPGSGAAPVSMETANYAPPERESHKIETTSVTTDFGMTRPNPEREDFGP